MFAICALLAVPCGGHAKASDEMRAADASVGNQPSVAPAAQTGGNTFVSDKFTMTYPDIVQESYADTEMGMLTATNDDIGITLNVTFSEMPWDPADYQEYYQGLTGMESSSLYQFEPPRIDGKIMTFKGVDEDGGQVCTFSLRLCLCSRASRRIRITKKNRSHYMPRQQSAAGSRARCAPTAPATALCPSHYSSIRDISPTKVHIFRTPPYRVLSLLRQVRVLCRP